MELHLLSHRYFPSDKSLLVHTKYQGQIYEASLKPLSIIAGEEKILVQQASQNFQRHVKDSTPQRESRIKRSGHNFRNTE